jgi:uncharacterized cupin superfamily protein
MLTAGDRFDNPTTGASFEVVAAPDGAARTLDIRRTMKPGTGKTLPHSHRDYRERFVVESGRASAKLDGRAVELGPGDEIEMPIGGSHVNAWNSGDEDLVMRHVFDPASDFALGYVATLALLMPQGKTNRQGEVPVPAAFAIAHATDSQTFAAGVPPAVQRRVIAPLGAAFARLRGYEVRVPG